MRRRPLQRRSRATVEAIEEAAALILEGGDDSRFTTNHIAERAGVGIGSLYEYFAGKEDIVRSHGETRAELLRGELCARMGAEGAESGDQPDLAGILAAALTPFPGRPTLGTSILRRYGGSPWAIALAQRQLALFVDLLGERRTWALFGRNRDEVLSLVPAVAAAVSKTGPQGASPV